MIGKPIVTVFTAVVMALIGFLDDHVISSMEWLLITIVALNAITVYITPNLNAGVAKYTKAIIQFASAAVGALILFWSNGVDLSEWLQVLVAALGAIGVVVPTAPQYSISRTVTSRSTV
jgi:small-conductance mechanosensitive channel